MDAKVLGEVEAIVPMVVIRIDGRVHLMPRFERMRALPEVPERAGREPMTPAETQRLAGPPMTQGVKGGPAPPAELPLLKLGPGGDYVRKIYASDLMPGCARCIAERN